MQVLVHFHQSQGAQRVNLPSGLGVVWAIGTDVSNPLRIMRGRREE
jgi:hypothetical protein